MNTEDHESPDRNRQVDEPDMGPDPDWLIDGDGSARESVPDQPDKPDRNTETHSNPEPPENPDVARRHVEPENSARNTDVRESQPEMGANMQSEPEQKTQSASEHRASNEPIDGSAVTLARSSVAEPVRRERPWLFWVLPLVILVITAVIAWFGSTQGLNNLTTWSTLRFQHTGLLPARWAVLMWWIVLPLLGVFLVYSALPAGREITRIKRTGPLLSIGLIGAIVWIISQHWRWDEIALISMIISLVTVLASYLIVALNKQISRQRQRVFSVVPLSATLGFTFMLLTISWQNYSTEPFGARGTSILFLFLLLIIAAIFSFFIHDGMVAVIFTLWFIGVSWYQWGDDAVVSLGAIVATILAAVIAVLGFIMALESHRPSLTTQISNRRGKVTFFKKSKEEPSSELP